VVGGLLERAEGGVGVVAVDHDGAEQRVWGVLDVAHRQRLLPAAPELPVLEVVGGVGAPRQQHIQRPLPVVHEHQTRRIHARHLAPYEDRIDVRRASHIRYPAADSS